MVWFTVKSGKLHSKNGTKAIHCIPSVSVKIVFQNTHFSVWILICIAFVFSIILSCLVYFALTLSYFWVHFSQTLLFCMNFFINLNWFLVNYNYFQFFHDNFAWIRQSIFFKPNIKIFIRKPHQSAMMLHFLNTKIQIIVSLLHFFFQPTILLDGSLVWFDNGGHPCSGGKNQRRIGSAASRRWSAWNAWWFWLNAFMTLWNSLCVCSLKIEGSCTNNMKNIESKN